MLSLMSYATHEACLIPYTMFPTFSIVNSFPALPLLSWLETDTLPDQRKQWNKMVKGQEIGFTLSLGGVGIHDVQ